jgi:hypothetical protein
VCAVSSVSHDLVLTKQAQQVNVNMAFCFATSISLEPGLPATSKFTWIDKGGLTASDTGVLQFVAGSLAATTLYNIQYSITDVAGNITVKHVAATIIVPSPRMNIKYTASAANTPNQYTLTAIGANVTNADWKLTVNNQVTFAATGISVVMPGSKTDLSEGTLTVNVVTNTGGTTCKATFTLVVNSKVFAAIQKAGAPGQNFPA